VTTAINSVPDLETLINTELGLPLTVEDAALPFDALPGWDSLHLLWLLSALERATARSLSLPDLLAAGSIEEIYRLATAPS
jgi:acyl carrier protein